jgi:hypothetical protein
MLPIRDLTANASPQEVVDLLKLDGIVRISNYLANVDDLKKDTLSVIAEAGGDYPFGKNVKTGPWLNPISKHPYIHKVYDSDWMRDITDRYLGKPNRYREGVFITHDFKSEDGLGRNGYLHFDRTRAFKFFFYLTDCLTLDDGPFMCYPGTQILGRDLRQAFDPKLPYAKRPNRLDIDYVGLGYTAESATPVYGKAGTLLIFDSDVFHLGGKVAKGHERLVLRSHSRTK